MQSLKKKDLMVRRDKYSASQYHFYFNANAKDYILFLDDKRGFIIMITEGYSKLLAQFQMEPIIPLHFVSTGWGDINILHEKGIMTQYIEQLGPDRSFHKIDFDRIIKPKKLIKIQENDFIIVTQDKTLVFLKDSKIVKQFHYPSQMMMQKLEIDCERREPYEARLIVPHRQNLFPFIFSVRQIREFKNENYLSQKIKKYSYYQDEILPSQEYKLCFSPSQSKIYLTYKNEMILLNIKYIQSAGIDYIATLYYRYKTRWDELPSVVSASNVTNTMVVINDSRFFEITPDKLGKSIGISIKQKLKDNRMVTAGYGLSNRSCVFLTFDSTTTRLLLI